MIKTHFARFDKFDKLQERAIENRIDQLMTTNLDLKGIPYVAVSHEPSLAVQVFGRKMIEVEFSRLERGNQSPYWSFEDFLNKLDKEGYEHITLRLDATDRIASSAINSLIGDPIVTMEKYYYSPHTQALPRLKLFCKVRPYEDKDRESLLNIVSNGLRFTRFYKDDFFPKNLCDIFYKRLLDTYLDNLNLARIVVGLKHESIVGFLAWKLFNKVIAEKNCQVSGSGLGIVLPGNPGCYPSIIHEAIRQFGKESELLEFDGQSDNEEVLRIFQFFGMEKRQSTAIYHKTLNREHIQISPK